MAASAHPYPDRQQFRRLLAAMLRPESAFYRVILVYSVAISLLTLAIPISVQMLIDTIANIGLLSAVVTIGLLLFALLLLSGTLFALRAWTMELWNRRLFSRVASEMAMTGLLARTGYFEEQQREVLFNRFFDIMTLKKNVPYLLSYGFSLFFQSVIGFVVVSLYHFYFFIFCTVLIVLLWGVWSLWGWKAIESGFHLSEAKHATAGWLQGLAVNNGFYKGRSRMQQALQRTDTQINHHLDQQEVHFRYSFRQLLSFLFIYAAASAVLLTMGGWLVIQGELSLGQLVAAELIMSAIFYGLPQMAGFLDYFYDVCAAVEELSRFESVETERVKESAQEVVLAGGALQLQKAGCRHEGRQYELSLLIPPGSVVRAIAEDGITQQVFCAVLKRQLPLLNGAITLGASDLADCDIRDLRQAVVVFDRQTLLPLSIRAYLALAAPGTGSADMHAALALLQLDAELAALPQGLDTQLSFGGSPLLFDQALRLKLAFALLSPGRVLILGQLFDCLSPATLRAFLRAWCSTGQRIAIYFTRRQDLTDFDMQLELGCREQRVAVSAA